MLKYIFTGLVLFSFFSCQENTTAIEAPHTQNKTVEMLFSSLSAEQTGVSFNNKLTETETNNLGFYDYFYNGAGVAIADINNDGKDDLFFAGNMVKNKLYLNEGGLKFKDISQKANIENDLWSTGVTAVDINQDGFLDFYVSNSSPKKNNAKARNQFFINNGDLTFTDRAKEMGVDDPALSSHAAFFDFDKDNDLDLFVLNHTEHLGLFANEFHDLEKTFTAKEAALQSCHLYRNDGNGKFQDITKAAGLEKPGYGLGLAIADLNEDGWSDIYVTNDFFIPDFMFINNQDGTFTDQIKSKLGHTSYYSMGCDAADINNDGLVDISVVDMTPSDHIRNKTLMASMDVSMFRYLTQTKANIPQYMFNTIQLNNGFGIFSEIGLMTNTSQSDWSWAALLADFDNDGWKDYLITNGYRRDTKHNDWREKVMAKRKELGGKLTNKAYYDLLMQADENPITNRLYKNNGDYTFTDVSKNWGFKELSFSNGAAYGDLDGDGDLEIVVNNIDQAAFIYENKSEQSSNNHLRVKLINSQSKQAPLNAKVYLKYKGQQQIVEYNPSRGYLSSVEQAIHFGIGQVKNVDTLEIVWNNGQVSRIINPAINKVHTVDFAKVQLGQPNRPAVNPLFADISAQQAQASVTYNENEYDDFAKEILLPHKQSNWGPCLCSGDVNKDGLMDYYLGGAEGTAGNVYLQQTNGVFVPLQDRSWNPHAKSEDGGCAFIDVNNDGLLDLYVSSGGGTSKNENDPNFQDRLYMNNGKGFIYDKSRLPNLRSNSGTVKSGDLDGDGDLDVVIAGRGKPAHYPFPSTTALLINDNGRFRNATKELAPDLESCGMVTDLLVSDFNGDKKPDIIAVGEWMNITMFENKNGKFTESTDRLGLGDTRGWWYSIKEGDFDRDGDMDYIVGNLGENNKFHPSDKKPLHVFAHDFDDNGSIDIVLSKNYKQNLVPLRGKECSTEQMPFISEKFPTYKVFSESTLSDIYTDEKLDKALHYQVNSFSSILLENNQGKFTRKKLPKEAQFFPILDMVVYDFNGDKNLDILCAGNIYDTEPETPRYDAGKGLVLLGNGKGDFNCSPRLKDNGIFFFGQVNELNLLPLGAQKIPTVVAGNNNSSVQFYALRGR